MTSPSIVSCITRGLRTRNRFSTKTPFGRGGPPPDARSQYGRKKALCRGGAPRTHLPHKIMITGAAGLLGRLLASGLGERYPMSGIDRDASRRGNVRRVDMTRPKAIGSLFEGIDTVIDL